MSNNLVKHFEFTVKNVPYTFFAIIETFVNGRGSTESFTLRYNNAGFMDGNVEYYS